jgi:hypothetical protein
VAGFERSVQIGVGIAVAVYLLTYLLPRRARETDEPVDEADMASPQV